MSLTYPGLIRHPNMSRRDRAAAARRAQACLDTIETKPIPMSDVHWLYDHTGYPRYTKSAVFMAQRIVDAYRLDMLTDRLVS